MKKEFNEKTIWSRKLFTVFLWWFIRNKLLGIYTTKFLAQISMTVKQICTDGLNLLMTGNKKVSTINYRCTKYVNSNNFYLTHAHTITFWFLIWIITRTPYSVLISELKLRTVRTGNKNLQDPVDFTTNTHVLLQ